MVYVVLVDEIPALLLISCSCSKHYLWSGQTQGSLLLWELVGESLQAIEMFYHSSSSKDVLCDTVHISSEGPESPNFFTYVYPGITNSYETLAILIN